MLILGVDTACDDTCASVVEDGNHILSNVISSQLELHVKYGGVVPEIAARKHLEVIYYIIKEALAQAGVSLRDLQAIAATHEHGLASSLLVGLSVAKAIAYAHNLPFIGVNHIQGHIYAAFLASKDIDLPHLCLTVAGGHTLLVYVKDSCEHEIIGYTIDDAAGEAFDKIARHLGLGFPGGPIIDRLAKNGNPSTFALPRPLINSEDFRFSFSGLKTAAINFLKNLKQKNEQWNVSDFAASFQEAVIDVLVTKTSKAAELKKVSTITITGGVAANSRLREAFLTCSEKSDLKIIFPPLYLCTDNAAMIAGLAYHKYKRGEVAELDLNVNPSVLI